MYTALGLWSGFFTSADARDGEVERRIRHDGLLNTHFSNFLVYHVMIAHDELGEGEEVNTGDTLAQLLPLMVYIIPICLESNEWN